jgi:Raf kinase inhibitor-like YbhB/YbcL family protein
MSPKKALTVFIGILLSVAGMFSPLFGAETKGGGTMDLKSSAFQSGGEIPRKHTCDANDVSPSLSWDQAPAGTKAFALIADDPDAPVGTWVHWVIYDLPGDTKELAEGIATSEKLANGAKQGINDFRKVGYGGPCPPPGPPHRYFFKLYALDAPTNLKPRATKQQLLDGMKGHVLSEAELMGRYKR